MKTILKSLLCALLLITLSSCSEDLTKPTSSIPIKLDDQQVYLTLSRNTGEIKIISGDGGYSIVFPKVILKYEDKGGGGVEIPYSEYFENILSLNLDRDDNIVIERKSRFNEHLEGIFMVKSGNGVKRLFQVTCWANNVGNSGLEGSLDSISGHLLNDESYWVNY
jgi:hypothetical protein